jgi:hypothetical protein
MSNLFPRFDEVDADLVDLILESVGEGDTNVFAFQVDSEEQVALLTNLFGAGIDRKTTLEALPPWFSPRYDKDEGNVIVTVGR